MAQVFAIDVTTTAYEHLASFRRYDRSRVLDAIREQLTHRPNQETRNKKMLRDNPVSD